MVNKETSSVSYHNKKPKFLDEVKVKLPALITHKHHILFTFFHVQCLTKKAKKDEKAEILVGHAFVPLLGPNGIVLDDGNHSLPIGTSFPTGYRDQRVQEVIKWVGGDNKKTAFTVKTKLTSSVYCQDEVNGTKTDF